MFCALKKWNNGSKCLKSEKEIRNVVGEVFEQAICALPNRGAPFTCPLYKELNIPQYEVCVSWAVCGEC